MPGTASLPTFLTVDELAAVLRCQPEKVYRLAARGELPSYKVEGRRLFNEAEIVRWLDAQRRRSTLRTKSLREEDMASIRSYSTPNGERRYEVRYRDGGHAALAGLLRAQGRAGVQARRRAPARRPASSTRRRPSASATARTAWLERYTRRGRARPAPAGSSHSREDSLKGSNPLNDLSVERIRGRSSRT